MKLKSTTALSTAIALALCANIDVALAQDAAQVVGTGESAAGEDYESVLEEVVVTGIRGSLQRSLDTKRDSDSHVEVISSEDIGKMPDRNIADSLQRVPGVTISAASANEGAFDENDRVSMRGTSPSYTQTLLNGHNVASGDWFVLNQTGTVGRSVSYSLLPSELVDRVVVHKSYEAKLVEGGLTGSIDIMTHSPLNFAEGMTFSGNLGAVYADLPGDTDPQLSGLFNWKNPDATIGVMVQAFYQQRHLRRDGQEILGYNVIGPADAAAVANPSLVGVFYPSLMGSALFEQERERVGGQMTVEFSPADNLTFVIDGFVSNLDAANYNRNYMLWGSRIIQGGAVPDAGYVVRDNTLVEANFTADPTRQYGIYDQISRPGDESSSEYVSSAFEWAMNEQWIFQGEIGTSEGSGKTPTQDVAEWDLGLGTGAGWQLNGVGAANWNLGSTETSQPGTPLEDVRLDWIFGYQDIDVEDEEDWLQLDSQYLLKRGALTSIDFGLRGADHSRDLDQVTAQGPGCIDAGGNVVAFDWSQQFFCPVGARSPFDPANWPSGYANYPGDFGSGLGGSFPANIWYYSPAQLTEYNEMTDRNPVSRFYYPGAYGLDETSAAAYVQFNFTGVRWSGNLGLRYVNTEEDITTYVNTSAADPDAINTSAFGPFKTVVTNHDYNDWLPTSNVRYELTDDMYLRGSATRTLGRPDYSALAGSVSLLPPAVEGATGSGSGGNPDLEPILSTNLDFTWEWYFAERALLSASVFYMDIDNYVALGREMRSIFTIDAQNPQGRFVEYELTIPVSSSADVTGFEIAWQQPFGENWGILANYSYADGDTEDGSPMLGTSENTYNLGGYFETESFSARVAYNYRSSFYSGLDRNSAFFQDDVQSVDASVGYTINDNFIVSLDGRNLTDETIEYYAESKERPRSIYTNGRQYYLNLRFSF
jgi:iron complex outermembrane receptor protein